MDHKKPHRKGKPKNFEKQTSKKQDDLVRLNKFIANSGLCSRREADEYIESGLITVNGKVVKEMGTKIKRSDKVMYGKKVLSGEKLVYIIMNKPKDCITTVYDPQGRKTVIDVLGDFVTERVFPVGRLDRNTTGLLLLTNDGDLADKLMHPKYEVRKIYQVGTDVNVKPTDLEKLVEGVDLEDGMVRADAAAYAGGKKNEVGLELHSGKNRVVRRMFEAMGYRVKKLDRVMFAGLTKKDVPRGKFRFLSDKEVAFLKMSK